MDSAGKECNTDHFCQVAAASFSADQVTSRPRRNVSRVVCQLSCCQPLVERRQGTAGNQMFNDQSFSNEKNSLSDESVAFPHDVRSSVRPRKTSNHKGNANDSPLKNLSSPGELIKSQHRKTSNALNVSTKRGSSSKKTLLFCVSPKSCENRSTLLSIAEKSFTDANCDLSEKRYTCISSGNLKLRIIQNPSSARLPNVDPISFLKHRDGLRQGDRTLSINKFNHKLVSLVKPCRGPMFDMEHRHESVSVMKPRIKPVSIKKYRNYSVSDDKSLFVKEISNEPVSVVSSSNKTVVIKKRWNEPLSTVKPVDVTVSLEEPRNEEASIVESDDNSVFVLEHVDKPVSNVMLDNKALLDRALRDETVSVGDRSIKPVSVIDHSTKPVLVIGKETEPLRDETVSVGDRSIKPVSVIDHSTKPVLVIGKETEPLRDETVSVGDRSIKPVSVIDHSTKPVLVIGKETEPLRDETVSVGDRSIKPVSVIDHSTKPVLVIGKETEPLRDETVSVGDRSIKPVSVIDHSTKPVLVIGKETEPLRDETVSVGDRSIKPVSVIDHSTKPVLVIGKETEPVSVIDQDRGAEPVSIMHHGTEPDSVICRSTELVSVIDTSTEHVFVIDHGSEPVCVMDRYTQPVLVTDLNTHSVSVIDHSATPVSVLDLAAKLLSDMEQSVEPVPGIKHCVESSSVPTLANEPITVVEAANVLISVNEWQDKPVSYIHQRDRCASSVDQRHQLCAVLCHSDVPVSSINGSDLPENDIGDDEPVSVNQRSNEPASALSPLCNNDKPLSVFQWSRDVERVMSFNDEPASVAHMTNELTSVAPVTDELASVSLSVFRLSDSSVSSIKQINSDQELLSFKNTHSDEPNSDVVPSQEPHSDFVPSKEPGFDAKLSEDELASDFNEREETIYVPPHMENSYSDLSEKEERTASLALPVVKSNSVLCQCDEPSFFMEQYDVLLVNSSSDHKMHSVSINKDTNLACFQLKSICSQADEKDGELSLQYSQRCYEISHPNADGEVGSQNIKTNIYSLPATKVPLGESPVTHMLSTLMNDSNKPSQCKKDTAAKSVSSQVDSNCSIIVHNTGVESVSQVNSNCSIIVHNTAAECSTSQDDSSHGTIAYAFPMRLELDFLTRANKTLECKDCEESIKNQSDTGEKVRSPFDVSNFPESSYDVSKSSRDVHKSSRVRRNSANIISGTGAVTMSGGVQYRRRSDDLSTINSARMKLTDIDARIKRSLSFNSCCRKYIGSEEVRALADKIYESCKHVCLDGGVYTHQTMNPDSEPMHTVNDSKSTNYDQWMCGVSATMSSSENHPAAGKLERQPRAWRKRSSSDDKLPESLMFCSKRKSTVAGSLNSPNSSISLSKRSNNFVSLISRNRQVNLEPATSITNYSCSDSPMADNLSSNKSGLLAVKSYVMDLNSCSVAGTQFSPESNSDVVLTQSRGEVSFPSRSLSSCGRANSRTNHQTVYDPSDLCDTVEVRQSDSKYNCDLRSLRTWTKHSESCPSPLCPADKTLHCSIVTDSLSHAQHKVIRTNNSESSPCSSHDYSTAVSLNLPTDDAFCRNTEMCDAGTKSDDASEISIDDDECDVNGNVSGDESDLETRIAQIIAEEDAEIMACIMDNKPIPRVIPWYRGSCISPSSSIDADSGVMDDEELYSLLGV